MRLSKWSGTTHPSVVVETGWAEKMADLKKDAKIWTRGVVIVVCFTEGKSPIAIPAESDEESLDKDEHSTSGTVNENTVGTAIPMNLAKSLRRRTSTADMMKKGFLIVSHLLLLLLLRILRNLRLFLA